MLQQLALLAVGAALACLGIIAGALADRIRGNRRERSRAQSRAERVSADDGAPVVRAPRAGRQEIPIVTGDAEVASGDEGRGARRKERSEAAWSPDVTPVPMLADVRMALMGLGFKRAEADQAAAEARRKLGDGAPLEVWIREALKHTTRAAAS